MANINSYFAVLTDEILQTLGNAFLECVVQPVIEFAYANTTIVNKLQV